MMKISVVPSSLTLFHSLLSLVSIHPRTYIYVITQETSASRPQKRKIEITHTRTTDKTV